MAQAKKVTKAKSSMMTMTWKPSWKGLFVSGSVALNVALLVFLLLVTYTNAVDGMFMQEGLSRYCSTTNDSMFTNASAKTQALRSFTCASGDAQPYFSDGYNKYLDSKSIAH